MFLIKIIIGATVYFTLYFFIYRRRFYKNPVGKRAVIKYSKTKVDIHSHHAGNMYNVISDTGTYGVVHISELKPVYFDL